MLSDAQWLDAQWQDIGLLCDKLTVWVCEVMQHTTTARMAFHLSLHSIVECGHYSHIADIV